MPTASAPLVSGKLATGVLVMVIGAICLIMFGRAAFAHPPEWVRSYGGWSSFALALPYAGVAMLLSPPTIWLLDRAPLAILAILYLVIIACVVVFFLSWFIWFPRFLLPGWYRRAKHAGVDVHEPASVEAFRQLPKSEQQARVARARETRARLKSS